jgi:LPS-assembly lipoprotein
MWWSRQPLNTSPKAPAAAALWLGVALALSACGFQPLYGRAEGQALSPVDRMALIRITPLPDRIGQQMHNLLRDRLNPTGQPREPAYHLDLQLSESRRELGIRKDETATRANLTLSAAFTLREAGSNAVLLQGQVSSVNSYNILTSQFATTFSESDARERALRELSDDIRTRLGIYFSGQPGKAS